MNSSRRSSSFDGVRGIAEPLFDMARRFVQVEGLVWRVSSVSGGRMKSLNWGRFPPIPRRLAEAMVAYMRHNVATKSPDHCLGAFSSLAQLGETIAAQSGECDMRTLMLQHLARLRGIGNEWRYHYVRDWYRWCFDQSISGLDEAEVLYELVSLRIPGNRKGEAVLSEDPDDGPLDEIEEIALRAALQRDSGSLVERTLTWMFLALGCNPKNLVHLQEADLASIGTDEHVYYTLSVPRIKKGVQPRAVLKSRKLDPALAALIMQLIERNANLEIPNGFFRPLFARTKPRRDCLGTDIEKYAYHFTSHDLRTMLSSYVERLRVISHRTGKPLRVSPRRLRYTFATRKVQEGCSMESLADLLDHTDLQNVMVYYAGTSVTKRLDEAFAVSVAPLVNRFMGRVVPCESEALNGGGRVKAQAMGRIKNIGTCGSTSLCTLYPPYSCYLCPVFQPWRDAPHREVLNDLVRQRDARIEDTGRADDRMAKQFDEIILAVGQVVAECESAQ